MATAPDEIACLKYAIGEALQQWSRVEAALTFCFGDLTGLGRCGRPYSRIIFGSIINMDARVKLMNQLVRASDILPDGRDAWPWLYNRLMRANKGRNQVTHATIVEFSKNGESDGVSLVPYFVSQGHTLRHVRLSAKQIMQRSDLFRELGDHIWWLRSQFPLPEGTPGGGPVPIPEKVARALHLARQGTAPLAQP
jgi:hypothetical protein